MAHRPGYTSEDARVPTPPIIIVKANGTAPFMQAMQHKVLDTAQLQIVQTEHDMLFLAV